MTTTQDQRQDALLYAVMRVRELLTIVQQYANREKNSVGDYWERTFVVELVDIVRPHLTVIEENASFVATSKVDAQLGREVEVWVCMNTPFSGEPPYVGNAGIMLALNELKDKAEENARDAVAMAEFATAVERVRDAADSLAIHVLGHFAHPTENSVTLCKYYAMKVRNIAAIDAAIAADKGSNQPQKEPMT